MCNHIPPFPGNINFNAAHSPMGAFMSFTCGSFFAGGGIGVEIGRPAKQNLFIGVRKGPRTLTAKLKCLPFTQGTHFTSGAANFVGEHAGQAAPDSTVEVYGVDEISRHFGWASDGWKTEDFTFTIHTPFSGISEPGKRDETSIRNQLLPAVTATLRVDNTRGTETKTAFFAIDFPEAGTRVLRGRDDGAQRLGFAWRRSMGVLGTLRDCDNKPTSGLFAIQRWSVDLGLREQNSVHALGTCGGLAFEVPPGESRTLVLSIGAYLDGVVTTGLEGKYLYTRYYSNLSQVLNAGLDLADQLQQQAQALDAELLASGLSADQQFLIAHGTRGYYSSTQLLDIGGGPFWVVNEGEYCMMNTLDLAVDQAFWELKHNSWLVRNVLDHFVRHYSYHDEVKSPGGELLAGGISFAHDMGVNNNFSGPGASSYELPHLTGCFSFMSQEQLCNWILTATCYVMHTNDAAWLRENAHVFKACAESMRNRAHPRSGVMTFDSALCKEGQEITTYDSLDESLGQARANTYLAGKCWAAWIGLDLMSRLCSATGGAEILGNQPSLAPLIERFLLDSAGIDGTLPAVIEKDNPGFKSRILPAAEALVYPDYWLDRLSQLPENDPDLQALLQSATRSPLVELLKQHVVTLLRDPQSRNLFADGGIKLSSTSNNSWMSKIALFQYVARKILRLSQQDSAIAQIFSLADAAHVKWQTDGSGYWACSDQFISGVAKGSRFYPRIITTALWMGERSSTETPRVEVSVFGKRKSSPAGKA